MNRLAEKLFLKCPSCTGRWTRPVLFIMKELMTTADTTTPAIWKAGCTRRSMKSVNSCRKTEENRMFAVVCACDGKFLRRHEEIYGSCRGRTAVPGRLYLGLYRPVNLQKDRYGKEFQAYGGDFDDHPCDYNFSGNGIVYGGERDASPKMQEVKFCYQNIAVDVQKDKAVVKIRTCL